LDPAAAIVRTIGGSLTGTIGAGVAAAVATGIFRMGFARVLVVLIAMLAGAAFGGWLGRQRWRRTRWKLDDRGFYVRRGWLWRSEVLVPRTRVQHLDLERGLLERQFGLASVVIHTAGSQVPALRQSGLSDGDAVALRDALIPDANRSGDAL
jgi:membrane protein YdbS with pleckstrin-like domain